MQKLGKSDRTLLTYGMAGAGVIGLIMAVLTFQRPALPAAFLSARMRATTEGAEIVSRARAANGAIGEAHEAALANDGAAKRAAIEEARKANEEARVHAGNLSRELRALTESLPYLSSERNQRLAYEAIAVELSFVGEFVGYTNDVGGFLDTIGKTVRARSEAEQARLRASLASVNARAEKLNTLHDQFLAKIRMLDRAF